MSDQVLRHKLIKLAQQKPELREHLVPLLRQANSRIKGYSDEPEDWDLPSSDAKKMPLSLCVAEYRALEMKVGALWAEHSTPLDVRTQASIRDLLRAAKFRFRGWQNGVAVASDGRRYIYVAPVGLHNLPVAIFKSGKSLQGYQGIDRYATYDTLMELLRDLKLAPKNPEMIEFPDED